MPPITNVQAIRFTRDRARIFADCMVTAYQTSKALVAEWNSQSVGAVMPNTTDAVVDGAELDGRPLAKGDEINTLITNATAFNTWCETGTPSRIDRFRRLAVNGDPRF